MGRALFLLLISLSLGLINCKSQIIHKPIQHSPLAAKDSIAQNKWVDSIYKKMSLDEKIGQLFMVQAYSNENINTGLIDSLITNYHVGGMIFMQGSPQKQVNLYNRYQSISKYPLLVGFDGEWGLRMRLKPTFAYPWNMTLGAVENDSLIYKVGQRIGTHCKKVGVHINFAPVVDINTNPKNPIIGNRSFGEDRENVTQKSIAMIEGMHSVGIMANAKHFPGHGDTSKDSHKTLPVLQHTLARLDSIELYPYKKMARSNLSSVMVAHLDVPVYDKGLPTSLSKRVITDILKDSLQFKGLIFTDGLNMNAVANYMPADSVCYQAFKAGNDMLLIPKDIKQSIGMIKKAIKKKAIPMSRLDESVTKILKAKYWAGLSINTQISSDNLEADLHTIEDDILYKKVVESCATLVKNEHNLLPLKKLDTLKVASIALGDFYGEAFLEGLQKYTSITSIPDISIQNYKPKLKDFNTVIIGFHKSDENPWKSYKFNRSEVKLIQEIAKYRKVVLQVFTSPYALLQLDLSDINSVVVGYQNNDIFQTVAPQLIFGALPYKGHLPVSIHENYKVGAGIKTTILQRLQYGFPEEVGMDSDQLQRIDAVADEIIKKKMTPGLQVLVARKNKVIFEKSYGFFTYKKIIPVQNSSVYDLASLTKILGALPLFLKAYEDDVYNLDALLGDLLPMYKDSPLDSLTVKEMLSHQSGLKAWIPFYKNTLEGKKPKQKWYRNVAKKGFDLKVAEKLYLKNEYLDSIYQKIKDEPLGEKKYNYSGLPFFLFKKVIEDYYQKPMDELLDIHYLQSIGVTSLTYNPLGKMVQAKIVPSEIDQYYRHQTLRGYVHDMAAAMFGGVSGNAGLFGNANDVAKMMQLFLNKGTYGNQTYFKPETFEMFNTVHYKSEKNRRGLILDKPTEDEEVLNTCKCNSYSSFGHSGFTGTFAWADPESELIYIFLSNRTYPTMKNNALGKNDIRTKVQKIVQEAVVN